jgi:hypothetical protein
LKGIEFTESFKGIANGVKQIVGFKRFPDGIQVPGDMVFIGYRIGFELNLTTLNPYKIPVEIGAIPGIFATSERVIRILSGCQIRSEDDKKAKQ